MSWQRVLALCAVLTLLAGAWTAYAVTAVHRTWQRGRAVAAAAGPLADAALVPGAAAWGEAPSPGLAERLDAAAALYKAGRVRGILLTGGVDAGGTLSEAEVGARYLERRHGIARGALALEALSTSTATNMALARPLLAARDWRTVAVVTHGYHLHRSLLLARDAGLSAVGVAAESRVLYIPYHVGRETLALAVYWAWDRWDLRGHSAAAVALAGAALLLLGGFVLMLLWALWVLRWQARLRPPGGLPADGVAVILPIKGLDPGAADHYRNWLEQAPGVPYEVIFSLQDPQDPVLPLLQDLIARHPGVAARVIVNPVRAGMNGKASNLWHGVTAARYPTLVMADSDIFPPRDLLPRLLPPLRAPRVGVVACLPVAVGATNFWGGVNALGINLTLGMQWAPLHQLGMHMGVSGACFAIRRAVLERIGGVAAFGAYVAEDARMATLVRQAGYDAILGPTVPLEQGPGTYAAAFSLMTRGAYMSKHMFPLWQQVVMGTLNFAPHVLVAAALALGSPLAVAAAAAGLAGRWLLAGIYHAASDPPRGWRHALLAPVLEAVGFLAVARAFVTDEVRWRGLRYRVRPGGRMELVK